MLPDEKRERSRLNMARLRQDPVKRAADNTLRRERWAERYGPTQRRRHESLRDGHFFRWRAYLVNRGQPVRITAADLARLWLRQRGRCALTGAKLDRTAELDHIVPVARGGPHMLANVRWVTVRANASKSDMTDAELLTFCRDVLGWLGRSPSSSGGDSGSSSVDDAA